MLPCLEVGDPQAPILFFIHGWPDTAHIWNAQLEHFCSRYRCIAVRLPAFEERRKAKLTFAQLEERLRLTLLEKLSESPHGKVTLVCHDWGALFGYLLEASLPGKIERLVTIDVGANFSMENWRQRIGIPLYQWWLVMAYFLGKMIPALGDWMTRLMAGLLKAPQRPMPAHSEMNYLYWYFWKNWFATGRFAGIDGQYQPSVPVLFLYGVAKPFHLHTQAWLRQLEELPESQSAGIDCDHWVMDREPAKTNAAIDNFLNRSGC